MVAFSDNYKTGTYHGVPIIQPSDLATFPCDIIEISSYSATDIRKQLVSLGIRNSKIAVTETEMLSHARDTFLQYAAEEINRKNVLGAVMEAGVFEGVFAGKINVAFPERKLYLFDTFYGFDERDIAAEEGYSDPERGRHFGKTSEELVMSKMKYPNNVIIKKGYVPDTFAGIEEKFCFVNLDMDLYKPTLAALEWVWPRMNKNGIVLIHDYFEPSGIYKNLKKAVIEFAARNDIRSMPIGDGISIALIK